MTEARQAKYCPRCRAMAKRDAAVCALCGHHFRSGVETPDAPSAVSPSPAEDELNRTRMFEMPPLVSRPPADAPAPPLTDLVDDDLVRRLRLRRFWVSALAVFGILLLAGLLVFLFVWLLR